MDEQLSFDEAKILSIIKWTKIVELLENDNSFDNCNITDFLRQMPELSQLVAECGFCERYIKNVSFEVGCAICEFGIETGYCTNEFSLFSNYTESFGYIKLRYAKQILEKIKSLKSIHNEI